jgi:hypothetical protein
MSYSKPVSFCFRDNNTHTTHLLAHPALPQGALQRVHILAGRHPLVVFGPQLRHKHVQGLSEVLPCFAVQAAIHIRRAYVWMGECAVVVSPSHVLQKQQRDNSSTQQYHRRKSYSVSIRFLKGLDVGQSIIQRTQGGVAACRIEVVGAKGRFVHNKCLAHDL